MDCSALPPNISHLSVYFTDDAEIKELNHHWRKKNKATDVLSFSQIEGQQSPLFPALGELVISLDTAKAQAKEFGVSLSLEILRLLVHGTLHLFGFDHEKVPPKEAAKMRRLEQKLFEKYAKTARF